MRGDIALFLGLVVVIGGGIVVAVVVVLGGGGGSGSSCDSPLASIGESDISQLGFQQQDVGLTRIIQAASVGNLQAATEALYGNDSAVHNFTHNVDPSFREVNEELARELCEAVNRLEDELINGRADRVAADATRIRELMRDAAEALGFARPGG